jgi:hypothetical protein
MLVGFVWVSQPLASHLGHFIPIYMAPVYQGAQTHKLACMVIELGFFPSGSCP